MILELRSRWFSVYLLLDYIYPNPQQKMPGTIYSVCVYMRKIRVKLGLSGNSPCLYISSVYKYIFGKFISLHFFTTGHGLVLPKTQHHLPTPHEDGRRLASTFLHPLVD